MHGIASCVGSDCAWDRIVRIKLFRVRSHCADCIMQIALGDRILWIAVGFLPRD